MGLKKDQVIWAVLRIGMGWIFLWAFMDKLWGLGFTTSAENAWLAGGSPTSGFLLNATKGPFAGMFKALGELAVIDWIFMLGLLLIGIALILGVAMRLASYSGALMLVLMYLAGFLPPEHNPILDDHIIYAIVLIGLYYVKAGRWFGLQRWWEKRRFVRRHSFWK